MFYSFEEPWFLRLCKKKIGSLSPKALPAASPVKRILLCFPAEHLWPLKCTVLRESFDKISQTCLHWKNLSIHTVCKLVSALGSGCCLFFSDRLWFRCHCFERYAIPKMEKRLRFLKKCPPKTTSEEAYTLHCKLMNAFKK